MFSIFFKELILHPHSISLDNQSSTLVISETVANEVLFLDLGVSIKKAKIFGLLQDNPSDSFLYKIKSCLSKARKNNNDVYELSIEDVSLQSPKIKVDKIVCEELSFRYSFEGKQLLNPLIITARDITILFDYSIDSPIDYGELKSSVMKFICGKLLCRDLCLTRPLDYNIIDDEPHFDVGKCLKAQKAIFEKVTSHSVYYSMKFGMARCGLDGGDPSFFDQFTREIKASGRKHISDVVPHFRKSFAIGRETTCHPIYEASLHALDFHAKSIVMENILLED